MKMIFLSLFCLFTASACAPTPQVEPVDPSEIYGKDHVTIYANAYDIIAKPLSASKLVENQ